MNRIAHALAARGLGRGRPRGAAAPERRSSSSPSRMRRGEARARWPCPINYRWRRDEIAYVLADAAPERARRSTRAFLDGGRRRRAPPRGGRRADRVLVVGDAAGWPSFDDAVAAAPDAPPPRRVAPGGFNIARLHLGHDRHAEGRDAPARSTPQVGLRGAEALVDDVGLPSRRRPPGGRPDVPHHAERLRGAASLRRRHRRRSCRRFDAEECLRLIATGAGDDEQHGAGALHPHPRAARRRCARRYDLSSVRKIMHAAAPCPPDVKRRIMQVFPPDTVWEFYGATEGPGTIISPSEWLARPGSVGRPWPGVTVKILDDDGGELPPGEVGHDLPVVARQPEASRTTTRRRRRRRRSAATSSPSATWAGSTPTATSTSPTASTTWSSPAA